MAAVDKIRAASGFQRSPIPAKSGIGLRFQHHGEFLQAQPDVGWLEVHTENYMGGGSALATLERIRANYPVSLHGVGLSLGTATGLDQRHLSRVCEVAERIEPGLVSEHLSWSVADGTYFADLLPLPMTEEALKIVCRNIDQAQTRLKRRILVENPSSYLQYVHSVIPEWEFMAELSKATGCGILCDVNNIHVSSTNHGWIASQYLNALPVDAVCEIHLAGHSVQRHRDVELRIDDHGSAVSPDVWSLFRQALQRFGPVPSLVEWDNDVPALDVLMAEADKAAGFIEQARRNARALAR